MSSLAVNSYVVLLGAAGILLFLFFVFVLWQVISLRKRLNRVFLGKSMNDLEGVLVKQIEHAKETTGIINDLLQETEELRAMATRSIQYVGLVRFNPFKDTGGNQSFTLALLDAEHNGMVVSALHSRTEARVYAKPLTKGKCEKYVLTEEEEEAITKAIGPKKKKKG